MSDTSNNAFLDEVLDPLTQCLTAEVAQRIVALRASPRVQQRIDELADKLSEGLLSAQERQEYETWVRAINFLGILQAKARRFVASATS